jgi:hypothetical protein
MSPEQSGSSDGRDGLARSAFSFGGGEGPAYFGPDGPRRGGGPGPVDVPEPAAGARSSARVRRARGKRMPLLAGALGLLLCGGAAIVLVGGGSSAGGASAAGSGSLARAAYVTTQSAGFQFQLNVSAKFGEHDLEITGEGAMDERTLEGSVNVDVEGHKLAELVKSPYAYIQLPSGTGAAIADGKPWVRANLDAYEPVSGRHQPPGADAQPARLQRRRHQARWRRRAGRGHHPLSR